ncbi:MAG: hypothetical protein QOH70_1663 [Blastocatellia bacterium]|nr:hypothetical protein [Blastocatellia bacterium]
MSSSTFHFKVAMPAGRVEIQPYLSCSVSDQGVEKYLRIVVAKLALDSVTESKANRKTQNDLGHNPRNATFVAELSINVLLSPEGL